MSISSIISSLDKEEDIEKFKQEKYFSCESEFKNKLGDGDKIIGRLSRKLKTKKEVNSFYNSILFLHKILNTRLYILVQVRYMSYFRFIDLLLK